MPLSTCSTRPFDGTVETRGKSPPSGSHVGKNSLQSNFCYHKALIILIFRPEVNIID